MCIVANSADERNADERKGRCSLCESGPEEANVALKIFWKRAPRNSASSDRGARVDAKIIIENGNDWIFTWTTCESSKPSEKRTTEIAIVRNMHAIAVANPHAKRETADCPFFGRMPRFSSEEDGLPPHVDRKTEARKKKNEAKTIPLSFSGEKTRNSPKTKRIEKRTLRLSTASTYFLSK